MAVRLFMPPHHPIQGRTKAGLSLEYAILDTTSRLRQALMLNSVAQKQNKSDNLQAPC